MERVSLQLLIYFYLLPFPSCKTNKLCPLLTFWEDAIALFLIIKGAIILLLTAFLYLGQYTNTTYYSVYNSTPPPPPECRHAGLNTEKFPGVPIRTRSRLTADRLIISAKAIKTAAWLAKMMAMMTAMTTMEKKVKLKKITVTTKSN